MAFQLKEKLIDVYAVAIGDNPEIDNLRSVVSKPLEDNIFMVSSPEALRAQARALVKRVCDGGMSFHLHCYFVTIISISILLVSNGVLPYQYSKLMSKCCQNVTFTF